MYFEERKVLHSAYHLAPDRFSIQPPLAGRDSTRHRPRFGPTSDFNSPLTGRDSLGRSLLPLSRNFNPPAPRGAGLYQCPWMRSTCLYFNPPAPRGAGHNAVCLYALQTFYFNPPAPRGAGPWARMRSAGRHNFNPPAPRGAGRILIQMG